MNAKKLAALLPCFVGLIGLCPGTAAGDSASTTQSVSEISPVTKPSAPEVLFEDSMTGNWQDNWFLDGKLATLRNGEVGLDFAAGTVTKEQDPEAYHAHHATLWTKKEFEGDLRITYEMTRLDTSDYGNILLYIQARGVGTAAYPEDIAAWKDARVIPAMDKYFENMNLISLSFRENLRCKRYPWKDPKGDWYPEKGEIKPFVDYAGMIPGKTYQVVVEKRAESVTLRLYDAETREEYADQTWDLTQVPDGIQPRLIENGRVGLRHMSTKQFRYKNFKIERL